jgi:Zn-dependent M28 family amino/carboxypeptidase
MEGRKTDTPGGRRAAEYIAAEFKKMNLEPMGASYFQPFEFEHEKNRYSARNVVGYVKGSRQADRYLLISAHYDHLGSKGDTVYYGADDNASGVALLIELAHYFSNHRPKQSIIFAAFDAEELGLRGSEHFCRQPPVSLRSLLLNLNLDMIARSDKQTIYIAGTKLYPQLKSLADHFINSNDISCSFKIGYDGNLPNQKSWVEASDHYNFHKKKIPFLYFGVEDHPDYHKHTDRFEKISPSFYFQVCKRIAAALSWYDNELK